MILTQDDRGFLESHKVYFEQAKMKFLHGFSPWVMDRFNAIFVKYVQPGYVLTPWCSECVIDMVTKLGAWYDGIRDEEMLSLQAGAANVAAQFVFPDDLDTITVQRGDTLIDAPIKKKAGRPKKKK
jgi:hypothetical protein